MEPVKGRPPASPLALQAASSPRSALLRTAGCSKLHRTFSLRRRPAGSIPFYSIHTKTGTPKASLFLCGASEGATACFAFRLAGCFLASLRSASDRRLLEAPPDLLPSPAPCGFDSLLFYSHKNRDAKGFPVFAWS